MYRNSEKGTFPIHQFPDELFLQTHWNTLLMAGFYNFSEGLPNMETQQTQEVTELTGDIKVS